MCGFSSLYWLSVLCYGMPEMNPVSIYEIVTIPIGTELTTSIFAGLGLPQIFGTTNRILCDDGCIIYTIGIDNSNLRKLIANGMQ